MSIPYNFWFRFSELQESSNPSIGYLYNVIYISKGTVDSFQTITDKSQIASVIGLDSAEVERIEKYFDFGGKVLYLAITQDFALYDLSLYDGNTVISTAFTQVVSPEFSQKPLGEFEGNVCFHTLTIPTLPNPDRVCLFYDPEKMGIGLGIFAKFLSNTTFFNQQLAVFSVYELSSVNIVGDAELLKTQKTSFLALDEANNTLLAYWTIGGKAAADSYIYELWKFNVKNELKGFLQVENPTYSDENILKINDTVDSVSESIKLLYSGINFSKAKTPLRDEQVASNIDNHLVDGVFVEYTPAGAIWFIGLKIKEV